MNIKRINIKNIVKQYLNNDIKFISEKNLNNGDIKQIRIYYSYINGGIEVIINIEQANGIIMISPFYENICKNIDLDDYIVDELFIVISHICNFLKESLRNILNEDDDIIVQLPIIKDLEKYKTLLKENNNENINKSILEVYNEAIESKKDFPNYVHKLLLYGKTGLYLAELFKELKIGEYERNFSGYEIKFIDNRTKYSNQFVDKLAFKLSSLGFICVSTPVNLIDRIWSE